MCTKVEILGTRLPLGGYMRVDWNVFGYRRERLSGGSLVHDYGMLPRVVHALPKVLC